MDTLSTEIIVALIGLYGTTLGILISHERRLTRIEGKIDVILNVINPRNKPKNNSK